MANKAITSKNAIKEDLEKQEKVRVRIFSDPSDEAEYVNVTINGYVVQIQKDEEVEVPKAVAEILENSKKMAKAGKEYAKKKFIRDIPAKLQQIIDEYNSTAPVYKRVLKLVVRETEFEKNTSRKIKRQ